MGGLSQYYYWTSVFFLMITICDSIFYFQLNTCPIDNSALGLFLFLIILNAAIFILMIFSGYTTEYFDQMDPDELADLGWFKNIISIICKLAPTMCKLVHYLKVLIVLVTSYFAFINNQSGVTLMSGANWPTTVLTLNKNCNSTDYVNTNFVIPYQREIVIFGAMEFAFVFITLFALGIIKNLIDINGYFYEPDNPEHGSCRKLFFRRLGP